MSGVVIQDEGSEGKQSAQSLRERVETACDIEIAMHMLRPQKVQALVAIMQEAERRQRAANRPCRPMSYRSANLSRMPSESLA